MESSLAWWMCLGSSVMAVLALNSTDPALLAYPLYLLGLYVVVLSAAFVGGQLPRTRTATLYPAE